MSSTSRRATAWNNLTWPQKAASECANEGLAQLQANEILYSSLIKACDIGGEWQVALELLHQMHMDSVRAEARRWGDEMGTSQPVVHARTMRA